MALGIGNPSTRAWIPPPQPSPKPALCVRCHGHWAAPGLHLILILMLRLPGHWGRPGARPARPAPRRRAFASASPVCGFTSRCADRARHRVLRVPQRWPACRSDTWLLDADAGVHREAAVFEGQHLPGLEALDQAAASKRRLDPNRWMKATAPICTDALSSLAAPGQWRSRHFSMTRKKLRSALFSAAPSRCMK